MSYLGPFLTGSQSARISSIWNSEYVSSPIGSTTRQFFQTVFSLSALHNRNFDPMSCILADFWTLPLTSTNTVYNYLPPQSVCLSKTYNRRIPFCFHVPVLSRKKFKFRIRENSSVNWPHPLPLSQKSGSLRWHIQATRVFRKLFVVTHLSVLP